MEVFKCIMSIVAVIAMLGLICWGVAVLNKEVGSALDSDFAQGLKVIAMEQVDAVKAKAEKE